MIPKCTDQDFLRYRYGKYREITTNTDLKIPIGCTTLVLTVLAIRLGRGALMRVEEPENGADELYSMECFIFLEGPLPTELEFPTPGGGTLCQTLLEVSDS